MKLKIEIEFFFLDFKEDIETINKLMGVNPDESTYIGQEYKMHSGEIRKWKENSWGFKSKYIDIEFEDAFKIFLKRLRNYKKKLIEFSKNNKSRFFVYYSYYDDRSKVYFLDKKSLKFINELNSEFEITIYDFSGDD